MLTPNDAQLLGRLQDATRDALCVALGTEPREVVYLDTPRHRNLGDTLIWQGGLRYLGDLRHLVIHHSDIGRYDDRHIRKLPATAVLVLNGGGNFGDLYGAHDRFRRHIVSTFPRRKIVMMPQSIQYRSRSHERKAYEDYRRGDDLTVLLREHRSIAIASERMPDLRVAFCHDVALGAEVPAGLGRARGEVDDDDIVVIARDDDERNAKDVDLGSEHRDWRFSGADALRWSAGLAPGVAARLLSRPAPTPARHLAEAANAFLMRENMRLAGRQYAGARAVVTNRLHAHVLAALLGIPHFVADNSYGKISSIYREYTGQFSTAHMVDSVADGLTAARRLVQNGTA